MQDTWVCLIPFLIVIPISMWTKQVQPGLFVGLLVGSYLMYPSLLGGVEHMIHYLVSNIVVKNNIRIVLFLYAFAGLVGMIKFTGGIKGFVHMIAHKIKTKKGAMLLTWLSTLGTFSEPDFRIVTIAPIMKALQKRLHMSKRRIAYAIEFTANPVIALIPVATAFVGYMVSVIGQALRAAGIHQTPYIVYVKSIPFNFFSFIIILVGIYYSFIKKTKKGEDIAFENAEGQGKQSKHAGAAAAYETQYPNPNDVSYGNADPAGGLQQPGENMKNSAVGIPSNPADIPEGTLSTEANTFTDVTPGMQMSSASGSTMDIHGGTTGMFEQPTIAQQQEDEDLKKKSPGDLPHADQQEDLSESHRAYKKETPIRPWNLIVPIGLFLILTLFLSWWDGHTKARGFFDAFIESDMLGVMLTSLLTAVIVALAYFIFQKFSVAGLATHFIKGGNELLNVIVMLSLIWALTAVSEDLGFSHYITAHVRGLIPHMLIAPALFVLGVLISYFIGSSWGTWGLLMPLGVTLAAESHTSILLAIGAVFASGTFGAFASPLSDNTVTTCTVLDLPVVKYARSKLAPALIAAGISVILFGVASFFLK